MKRITNSKFTALKQDEMRHVFGGGKVWTLAEFTVTPEGGDKGHDACWDSYGDDGQIIIPWENEVKDTVVGP